MFNSITNARARVRGSRASLVRKFRSDLRSIINATMKYRITRERCSRSFFSLTKASPLRRHNGRDVTLSEPTGNTFYSATSKGMIRLRAGALLNTSTLCRRYTCIRGCCRPAWSDFAMRFRARGCRAGGGDDGGEDGETKVRGWLPGAERMRVRYSIALVCFTIQRRSATLFKYSGCSVVVGVRQ